MGSHAVPVLSTLTFLSYTKLVHTIVIVLHKREVTLHCTADESVRLVSLWYEDPNVEYAKGKHAGLFGFALLVSIFFVIPYTHCSFFVIQYLRSICHILNCLRAGVISSLLLMLIVVQ